MNLWLKKHLYHLAVPFLVRRARRNNLCFGVSYHRFESAPGADPKPGMAVTPELLRRQIGILRELGPFISIDDAISEPRPDGISFVLSFDDGYRDNLTVLLPILEEMQIPCTFYITSGLVSGELSALDHDRRAEFCPPVLTLQDLKILALHPFVTIGSHTHHHVRLSTLNAEELEAELRASRDWFQKKAELEVKHLAIPFGRRTDVNWPDLFHAAGRLGFISVASNCGGHNGKSSTRRPCHFHRSPAPNTEAPDVLTGWIMGLCNARELFRRTPCLKK